MAWLVVPFLVLGQTPDFVEETYVLPGTSATTLGMAWFQYYGRNTEEQHAFFALAKQDFNWSAATGDGGPGAAGQGMVGSCNTSPGWPDCCDAGWIGSVVNNVTYGHVVYDNDLLNVLEVLSYEPSGCVSVRFHDDAAHPGWSFIVPNWYWAPYPHIGGLLGCWPCQCCNETDMSGWRRRVVAVLNGVSCPDDCQDVAGLPGVLDMGLPWAPVSGDRVAVREGGVLELVLRCAQLSTGAWVVGDGQGHVQGVYTQPGCMTTCSADLGVYDPDDFGGLETCPCTPCSDPDRTSGIYHYPGGGPSLGCAGNSSFSIFGETAFPANCRTGWGLGRWLGYFDVTLATIAEPGVVTSWAETLTASVDTLSTQVAQALAAGAVGADLTVDDSEDSWVEAQDPIDSMIGGLKTQLQQTPMGGFVAMVTAVANDLNTGSSTPGSCSGSLNFDLPFTSVPYAGTHLTNPTVDYDAVRQRMADWTGWSTIRWIVTFFVMLGLLLASIKVWMWAWSAYQWSGGA